MPIHQWRNSPGAAATTVYFVKTCAASGAPCAEPLIPSNYEHNGRAYLLNVEPGEYRPVAAAYEQLAYYVIGTSRGLHVTYLPDALAREASVHVQAGRMSDAGHHMILATESVCRDTADPGQFRYAEMMEPGTKKCGVLESTLDSFMRLPRTIGRQVVVGGKAYPYVSGVLHFRGVSHETRSEVLSSSALEEARKDLESSGWHVDGQTWKPFAPRK